MLERIDIDSDGVLAFRASGDVSAEDYEQVLIPAIEQLLQDKGRIRLLYHLGPQFTGFTMGALWDDARLGLSHFSSWERIALVTDIGWLRKSAPLISLLVPGETRLFSNDELDTAIVWLVE